MPHNPRVAVILIESFYHSDDDLLDDEFDETGYHASWELQRPDGSREEGDVGPYEDKQHAIKAAKAAALNRLRG